MSKVVSLLCLFFLLLKKITRFFDILEKCKSIFIQCDRRKSNIVFGLAHIFIFVPFSMESRNKEQHSLSCTVDLDPFVVSPATLTISACVPNI